MIKFSDILREIKITPYLPQVELQRFTDNLFFFRTSDKSNLGLTFKKTSLGNFEKEFDIKPGIFNINIKAKRRSLENIFNPYKIKYEIKDTNYGLIIIIPKEYVKEVDILEEIKITLHYPQIEVTEEIDDGDKFYNLYLPNYDWFITLLQMGDGDFMFEYYPEWRKPRDLLIKLLKSKNIKYKELTNFQISSIIIPEKNIKIINSLEEIKITPYLPQIDAIQSSYVEDVITIPYSDEVPDALMLIKFKEFYTLHIYKDNKDIVSTLINNVLKPKHIKYKISMDTLMIPKEYIKIEEP